MNKQITIWLLCGLSLFTQATFAQLKDQITRLNNPQVRGNMAFENFNYEQAANFYKKAIDLDSGNHQLMLKIGDCYYQESNLAEAANWYGQVLSVEGIQVNNIYKLRYAQSLMALGKSTSASYWFEQHHKTDTMRMTENRIVGIEMRDIFLSSAKTIEVNKLEINSAYRDYSPSFFKRGIVFVSEKPNQVLFKKEEHDPKYDKVRYSNLYYAERRAEGHFNEPEILGNIINTDFHEGPMSVFNENKTMAFTRNGYLKRQIKNSKSGVNMLQIYFASLNSHDHWSDIRPFPYNNSNYSSAHPAVSNDGKVLIFASNKPGGYGGTDLYYCMLDVDSTWSKPKNLGPEINTEGNELFPNIDGPIIYFASNGHAGLGGLDIYKTYFDNGEVGMVTNVGAPINSNADDFSLIVDETGNGGYFTSNRGYPLNDDIYEYKNISVSATIEVIDSKTKESITDAKVIVNLNDRTNKTWEYSGKKIRLSSVLNRSHQVRISGEHYFERRTQIEMGMDKAHKTREFVIQVKRKPDLTQDSIQLIYNEQQIFLAFNGNVYTPHYGSDVVITDGLHDISMGVMCYPSEHMKLASRLLAKGYKLKQPVVVDNIYYATNLYELREKDKNVLDGFVKVLMEYPELNLFVNSHADSRGSKEYNLMLSEKRAQAAYDYLVSQGVEDYRLKMLFFGEHVPENDCIDGVNCNDDDYQKNRKSEFGFFVTESEF